MGKIGAISFEVEIVIAIVAALIVSVIFYLNVKLLIDKTYDVKRLNDTIVLSEAISLYTVEKGSLPPVIETTEKEIGTIDGGCKNTCNLNTGCVNLLALILSHLETKNLGSLDGYTVRLGKGGMVTVKSCISKSGEKIEVTR